MSGQRSDNFANWAINGRFLTQPQTGVQRYAREITLALDACLAADETLARRMRWELLLPAGEVTPPSLEAIHVRRAKKGTGHLWEQTVLPLMARGGLLDLCNLGPLAHGNQILCLHDANVFLEPSSYSRAFRTAYRAVFPRLARRARAVTTVSGFSAQMLDTHGVTPRRPRVIHNGHEHALRWDRTRSHFSVPGRFRRPFVFALGSRAKHKQLDLLMGLAPALDARGIDIVVSGGASSIFAGMEVKSAPNVFPVGFVSDDDLASLFSQALLFAFPSRTEGFGIPLLEAMVHGAPILTSQCASMPEVCGDAALYAPPDDSAVWLAQIDRLAADADLREALRARGQARYPRFSWHDGATAYVELALGLSPRRSDQSGPVASRVAGSAPQ